MQAAAAHVPNPLNRPAVWAVGALTAAAALLVAIGVVAERGGVELLPLIGFVWLAAAGGDLVSFLLGRRLGRPFLERHGPRFQLTPDRLARVDGFYARHGGKAVLLGRFTGLVRAVSPFVAGASGLALRRFVLWSAAGALLWATTFTLVGYGFSESFAQSGETAARIGAGAAGAAPPWVAAGAPTPPAPGGLPPQVDARQGDGRRDGERPRSHARAQDRHRGGGGEGGGAVARREGRIARNRDQRAEVGIGHGRAVAVEGQLEPVDDERRRSGGHGGGGERHRQGGGPHLP